MISITVKRKSDDKNVKNSRNLKFFNRDKLEKIILSLTI